MAATLLVIDDDPDIVQLLDTNLREEGYTVVTGHDGQMALNLAQSRKPNLIIMDVEMPMTNGLKAFQFLRQNPKTQNIPVIFLSGASSGAIYSTIESANRVVFLKKPVDIESLNSLVRQVLQQYSTAA